MAITVKSLYVGNGEYQFVGKTWYGTCTTAASTQTKLVYLNPSFYNSDFVEGTKITVSFRYGNTANNPNLRIANTNTVYSIATTSYKTGTSSTVNTNYAESYEWNSGAIIDFVFNGVYWVIEDGEHATQTHWGKTKLSDSLAEDSTVSATPQTVVYGVRNVYSSQYSNEAYTTPDERYVLLLNTTTPATWENSEVTFTNIDFSQVNGGRLHNRIVKVTYDNEVIYCPLTWGESDNEYYIELRYDEGGSLTCLFNITDNEIVFYASNSYLGVHTVKVEFYYDHGAGFVSYPMFKDTVGDIETLLASI